MKDFEYRVGTHTATLYLVYRRLSRLLGVLHAYKRLRIRVDASELIMIQVDVASPFPPGSTKTHTSSGLKTPGLKDLWVHQDLSIKVAGPMDGEVKTEEEAAAHEWVELPTGASAYRYDSVRDPPRALLVYS